MNKTQEIIKYSAIAFAVFIIINILGGILYTISFVINFTTNDIVFTEQEYSEVFNNVKILDIDLSSAKLKIEKGPVFKVEANNITNKFKVKENNNKLIIQEKINSFYKKNKMSEVIIFVPDTLDELLIDIGAGILNVDSIAADLLKLNSGAGKVHISKSSFNHTNIDGGVGEINITSSVLNNLYLDSGVGHVDLKAEITGHSIINSGIGKVELTLLGDKKSYQIDTNKGIGKIQINGSSKEKTYGNGQNKLKIDGGIGEILVNFK